LFIKIPFHEKNRKVRLIRQETDFRKKRSGNQVEKHQKDGKSPEIRGFSHEKARLSARLSLCALQL
jgi:hypothetical protein